MLRIATTGGSVYHVCFRSHTWARVSHAPHSSGMRNEHGTFRRIGDLLIGRSMLLICPPLDPRCDIRIIETTPIREIVNIVGPHDRKLPLMLADIPAVVHAKITTTGEIPGQTPLT